MAGKPKATKTPAQIQAASEEKRKKLSALASKRVTKAINALRMVGNLGAYKPTETQSNAIGRVLADAYNEMKARLQGSAKTAAGFTLPE